MEYNYQVRGECFSDISKLLSLLFEHDFYCKVTLLRRLDISGFPIPDTILHFVSHLDIRQIHNLLREGVFPEAYVMRNSLKRVE